MMSDRSLSAIHSSSSSHDPERTLLLHSFTAHSSSFLSLNQPPILSSFFSPPSLLPLSTPIFCLYYPFSPLPHTHTYTHTHTHTHHFAVPQWLHPSYKVPINGNKSKKNKRSQKKHLISPQTQSNPPRPLPPPAKNTSTMSLFSSCLLMCTWVVLVHSKIAK